MIVAGLMLLAVGGAALVRSVFRRAERGIRLAAFGVVGAAILAIGLLAGAPLAAVAGLGAAALWLWLMPDRGSSPASIWPAAGLGALSALAVVVVPAGYGVGAFGRVEIDSPLGVLSLPAVILMLGTLSYLLEAANVVVRAALERENIAPDAEPGETQTVVGPEGPTVMPKLGPGQVMKGGRLIGPLERAIVFGLTLAAAYPLLAAFIAAKGIVRFPEISRDGDGGDRAEYFLVGSMVSWVQALSAAFLVWWGLRS
ncbi:hypothetical protein ACH0AH_11695 [Microbacterium paludicola]|uniref:Uncharacterized protein n=1 Tax=Microbacterium paludicola TaxID=300019 RepID=A0A4Y9FWB8_9MICO|nr:hypothetical protein [Microbacterium paludicola]MBF0816744.1 hypothetical protein [Microbacterium paludicola]TFU32527.1 hypothetical protein E4U02_09995 [Microbacterium paludicola]